MTDLADEIATVINRASVENRSDTPDFILAKYLERCLEAFEEASNARLSWWSQPDQSATKAEGPSEVNQ